MSDCPFKHGTAEDPISELYGVPPMPLEDLPQTCHCGAPLFYADEVAFFTESPLLTNGVPVFGSQRVIEAFRAFIERPLSDTAVLMCSVCGKDPRIDLCEHLAPQSVVHLSDWAQQPDVRIFCTQEITTPSWGARDLTKTPGVYEADNGELYSFETSKVTCSKCRLGIQ